MRISITLDDVIRAKTRQFGVIYNKYIDHELDLSSVDLSTGDLSEAFKFKTKKDYQKFLYEDYVFEIFGKAPMMDNNMTHILNKWLFLATNEELEGTEEEKVEVSLTNPLEFNLSIGNTLFFLSKLAPRTRNYYFPLDSITTWDMCDILVTANQKLLANKPEGKISVKIETDYNKKEKADFTYSSFKEFTEDLGFFVKVKEIKDGKREK